MTDTIRTKHADTVSRFEAQIGRAKFDIEQGSIEEGTSRAITNAYALAAEAYVLAQRIGVAEADARAALLDRRDRADEQLAALTATVNGRV